MQPRRSCSEPRRLSSSNLYTSITSIFRSNFRCVSHPCVYRIVLFVVFKISEGEIPYSRKRNTRKRAAHRMRTQTHKRAHTLASIHKHIQRTSIYADGCCCKRCSCTYFSTIRFKSRKYLSFVLL